MNNKAGLTVIMPTYNESEYIEKSLSSASFANQIIVIDSYSTDTTKELAQPYSTLFLERNFDNFSAQKNHALSFAENNWVLFLDADEIIPYPLQKEILSIINSPVTHKAYYIKFRHFYMGRFLQYGTQGSDKVIRLIHKEYCKYSDRLVHEKMEVDGSIGVLQHAMTHYTFRGLKHYISKKDKYAWFQAKQLYNKNKKANLFHYGFKPFFRFFNEYYLRFGFLDGVPGFAIACINAYGVFSRYVKLNLLRKNLE